MIRQELECDAVVVGAGPAGATAAAALAGSVSVVVLERKAVVEGKACAGGVLSRANKHLPPNALLRWQDDGVRVFTLTHRQRDGFSRDARRPLVRAVLRSEFDRTLIQWAEQQGARVLFGHRVSRIDVEDAQVRVTTDGLRVHAKVVVGADGANSVTARQCGLVRRLDRDLALVMRVVPRDMRPFRHHAAIDWDSPPGGYSWLFPKLDHLSVGAVGPGADRAALATCARDHLNYHAGDDCAVVSQSVGLVPLATSDLDRAGDRVVLVGDAAALVDPFTREGITWALWSGRLAAQAALRFLRGSAPLEAYEHLLQRKLLPEPHAATAIARWFYADPGEARRSLRDRSWVWSGFCHSLTGRLTHRALCNGLFLLPQGDAAPRCCI
jgi:geranylgeranyl reductase family protein